MKAEYRKIEGPNSTLRLVIPFEFAKALKIKPKDFIKIQRFGKTLILRKIDVT